MLVHVYMLGSDGDYIAHRKLWSFLVERMTEDLALQGVDRPDRWDARLVTYRKGESPDEVTELLREIVGLSPVAPDSQAVV